MKDEGRHLLAAGVEHLRAQLDEANKHGTLSARSIVPFWLAWGRDSSVSALSGRRTCVTDADVEDISGTLVATIRDEGVMALVSSDDEIILTGTAYVALLLEIIEAMKFLSSNVNGRASYFIRFARFTPAG